MAIIEFARAKINLTLKVLGRRPDGYHELDSLVTFAEIADQLTFDPDAEPHFAVDGPFASEIVGENLVQRALWVLHGLDSTLRLGAVRLRKNLPVAAGVGGGSADAAALLRAVRRANPLLSAEIPWFEIAARLGADVPVCFDGRPARMRGVGDRIDPISNVPALNVVLINPRLPLSTRDVFKALDASSLSREHESSAGPVAFASQAALLHIISSDGNDLEGPATALLPEIGQIKSALTALPGCLLASMSGSGPTCFGLFDKAAQARAAAETLSRERPGWWVVGTRLAGAEAE
jgi:4-diphosphocytidyl-2-C-methyl-D-erythritol kinase